MNWKIWQVWLKPVVLQSSGLNFTEKKAFVFLCHLKKHFHHKKEINCDCYKLAMSPPPEKKSSIGSIFSTENILLSAVFTPLPTTIFFLPLLATHAAVPLWNSQPVRHAHAQHSQKRTHGSPQNHYSCSSCLTEHQTINKRQERHSSQLNKTFLTSPASMCSRRFSPLAPNFPSFLVSTTEASHIAAIWLSHGSRSLCLSLPPHTHTHTSAAFTPGSNAHTHSHILEPKKKKKKVLQAEVLFRKSSTVLTFNSSGEQGRKTQ